MAQAECQSWPVRARNAACHRVPSPGILESRRERTPLAQSLEVSALRQGSVARTRPSRGAAEAPQAVDRARPFRRQHLEPWLLSSPYEPADRLRAIAHG